MKKSLLFSNIIIALLILLGDIIYMFVNGGLLVKTLTSLGFVLLGILNLWYLFKNENNKYRKFAIFMLVGLVFAFGGDVMLEIVFELGAGLFAIGHVFYFIAYCTLIKFRWLDLIPAFIIIIPVVLFIVFSPLFDFGGMLMEMVVIIYAIIISFMVDKAISNLIQNRNYLNIIIMIGSFLFMFSDFMLLFSNFAKVSRVFGVLCLSTYYPGQIVLAIAILFASFINSIDNPQEIQ